MQVLAKVAAVNGRPLPPGHLHHKVHPLELETLFFTPDKTLTAVAHEPHIRADNGFMLETSLFSSDVGF